MLYRNADADHRPERVTVEPLPNGETAVRMADNITEYTAEETPDRVMFRFDEVAFVIKRILSADEVEGSFAYWWEYGQVEHDEGGDDEVLPDDLYALRAVIDYNIMLGNLEDPTEEDADDE